MGLPEIVLVFVAALILAANQGFKDAPQLTEKLPWLRPKSWWNYIPILLLVLAAIVYLARPSIVENDSSIKMPPGEGENKASPGTKNSQETMRRTIPLGILTMNYDEGDFDRAQQMLPMFDGAAVRVSGQIESIFSEAGRRTAWLTPEAGGRAGIRVILWFRDDQGALLGRLGRRQTVASRCTFKARFDAISLTLEDCTLVGGN